MQSPAANTPGIEVRSCSSAATPLSSAMPEPVQPADRGPHPHRGDHLVGGQPAAARPAPGRPACTDSTGWPSRSSTPAACVPAGGQRADLGAHGRGQRRRGGLQHGHPAAAGRRRRGQLGADPAGAHDRQPQPRAQPRPQRQRVVQRAQEPLPAAARQARPASAPVASTSRSNRCSPRSVRSTPLVQAGRGLAQAQAAPSASRSSRSVVSATSPAISRLDSGGRSYGGRVSAPTRVTAPAYPAGPELFDGAQAGQPAARHHDPLRARPSSPGSPITSHRLRLACPGRLL